MEDERGGRFAKLFGGWELCDGIDADFCRRGSNSAYTRKARPSWRKKPLRLFVLPFHADVIRSHPPGRSGYETNKRLGWQEACVRVRPSGP